MTDFEDIIEEKSKQQISIVRICNNIITQV
jgi:hypothetical protein